MRRIFLSIILLLALTPLRAQMQEIERLIPKVLNIYPHDANAFTQGLLWHDGYLYESTGLYGESTMGRVDIESGVPMESLSIDEAYFAEGLELAGRQAHPIDLASGHGFCLRCRQLRSDRNDRIRRRRLGLVLRWALPLQER